MDRMPLKYDENETSESYDNREYKEEIAKISIIAIAVEFEKNSEKMRVQEICSHEKSGEKYLSNFKDQD